MIFCNKFVVPNRRLSIQLRYASDVIMSRIPDIVLFDTDESFANLLPLSFTRPVADFRVGIDTIRDKWAFVAGVDIHYYPVYYLRDRFSPDGVNPEDALYIAGNVLPDDEFFDVALHLNPGEAVMENVGDLPKFSHNLPVHSDPHLSEEAAERRRPLLAFRGSRSDFENSEWTAVTVMEKSPRRLQYIYDVFLKNGEMLTEDFFRITKGRKSAPLSVSNRILGDLVDREGRQMLFIEPGATVEGVTINLTDGPVYIGKEGVIEENASVRGPFALGEHSTVKMGCRIYEGTTLGPYCKVGGELSNAVIFGYSNKAHEGYLGNAVIGEWCNLGAGTNASNLKNDYSKIRLWNYAQRSFMRTDLQFCGLIMGDHSKAGINTMFNTATVVGVGVNIHGAGFPRVFIPSYSKGSAAGGFNALPLKEFYAVAERVMARRGKNLTDADRKIYEQVEQVASIFK